MDSYFLLTSIKTGQSLTDFIVSWLSVSGRVYEIQRAMDLAGPFITLQDGITFPQGSYTNSNGLGRAYFRLKVNKP